MKRNYYPMETAMRITCLNRGGGVLLAAGLAMMSSHAIAQSSNGTARPAPMVVRPAPPKVLEIPRVRPTPERELGPALGQPNRLEGVIRASPETIAEANRVAFERFSSAPITQVIATDPSVGVTLPRQRPAIEFDSARGRDLGSLLFPEPCDPRDPPKITRIRGIISPGNQVRINGTCFGEAQREVRLRGSTIPGVTRLIVSRWSVGFIEATIPPISGATPGDAELQVINSEGLGSVTSIVPFVPLYEVRGGLGFDGCADYVDPNNRISCMRRSIRLESWEFTGVLDRGENKRVPITRLRVSWGLNVHPSCRLVSAGVSGYQFKPPENFRANLGAGEPNRGSVSFILHTDSRLEVRTWGDILRHYGSVTIGAEAECPVGINPQ